MAHDYPLIRFHGRVMGSNQDWIEDEVRRARREGAPEDAWAWVGGRWSTPTTCKSDYRARLYVAWQKYLEGQSDADKKARLEQ